MKHTRAALAQSLKALGLRAGDVVMIHASLRAVGPAFGGADQVHLAVEDATAPGGTLMMYVSCEHGYDDVGRSFFTPEQEAALLEHQPPFDFQTGRANREFGVLAELFRSWPGTICSRAAGPRLAARGAKAGWLTSEAPWNYGFGVGSPLAKLCETNGHVLLLGSTRTDVTLLHHAEHIADFPDKRIARYQVPLLRDSKRVWASCEEFNTGYGEVHANWPDNFFALIVDDFIARNDAPEFCRRGRVGDADCILLNARTLVDHAVPIMVRQAHDRNAHHDLQTPDL